MANQILKYTSKDYESIASDLLDAISALTGTWTSREEGDPGIVLVKLMSAVGDMLSYNFDKQALEYYAPTVTQRKNAAKLFALVGYYMKWYRSAMTQVTLTNTTPMEEYVYIYKQYIEEYDMGDEMDIEKLKDLFMQYVGYYKRQDIEPQHHNLVEVIDFTPYENDGQDPTPLPQAMIDAGVSRYTIYHTANSGVFSRDSITPQEIDLFNQYASSVYKFWGDDNSINIYRNLANQNVMLSMYGGGNANLVYSLVPTAVNYIPSINPVIPPDNKLRPYEPLKLQAIQGYLNKVSFTSRQLRDNRFYLPDPMLDEEHMYLSYSTIDNNQNIEKVIFIDKTDNILTETDYETDPQTKDPDISEDAPKIYFQFGVDDFDYPYIELSSYWSDYLGEDAVTFTFYYFKTVGRIGAITDNYLTSIGAGDLSNVVITNYANSDYRIDETGKTICSPGFNPQTAEDAYRDSINYIMTYDTLVTIYDFTRATRRQDGISNAFACDNQYMIDLNSTTLKQCQAYSKKQLLSILGPNADSTMTQEELAQCLYNIRQIFYSYKDNIVTVDASKNPGSGQTAFVNYTINLYPIVGTFKTEDEDGGIQFAKLTNTLQASNDCPYLIYKINTQSDSPSYVPENYKYETQITEAIDETRIVNVTPNYNGCRVFPWRCCGTVHLKQMVSQSDADNIVEKIIQTLAAAYTPYNLDFGQKLTYMEVIDTILSADSRIRYFDAGIGSKKLIDFESQKEGDSNYYNIEAYFNPESIMQYVQTVRENNDETSAYYNMICIDPTYIQEDINILQ